MKLTTEYHSRHRRVGVVRTTACRLLGGATGLVSLLAPLLIAAPAGEPNIFDDDWWPPQRFQPQNVVPPRKPSPATKPAAAATQPAVVALPPPEIALPVAPTVLPARRPVPAMADQLKSRKLMREIYAKQLADTTLAGRRAFANVLLEDAAKVADAPSDHFVLLGGAVEAAAGCGSISLCVEAAEQQAAAFDVDSLAVKWQAVRRMKFAADATLDENLRAGLAIVDQLVVAEDFNDAAKLGASLSTVAAASPIYRAAVLQRNREVAQLKANRDKVLQNVDRLMAAPDDPAANQAVGMFFCFEKGDWQNGLPMLAAGENPAVKAAAVADKATPTNAVSQVAAGDAWWDASEKEQKKQTRAAMRQRAAHWYRQSIGSGQLAGLSRIRLEKRIDESNSPADAPPPAPPLAAAKVQPAGLHLTDGQWTRRWTVKGAQLKPELRVQTYTVFENGNRMKALTQNLPFIREADGSLSLESNHYFQLFSRNGDVIECREWTNRTDYLAAKLPLYIGVFEPK